MAAIITQKLPLIQQPETIPTSVEEVKDLRYGTGGGRDLELDLYLPRNDIKQRTTLLFLHGGAWSGGSREVYKYYTVMFAQKGYVSATASYRLSGEAPYPAAIHDVKAAVRWLRAQAEKYRIHPDRIVAVGGSAGGHLALMLGYSPTVSHLEGTGGHSELSSAVQGVINFYGPVDLTTNTARSNGSVRKFLQGKTYEEAAHLYEEASPLTHLNADAPPTLVVHGTLDETVKIRQADLLAEKLASLQVRYAYARLEGWPHTLDAALSVNQYSVQLMESFLQTIFP